MFRKLMTAAIAALMLWCAPALVMAQSYPTAPNIAGDVWGIDNALLNAGANYLYEATPYTQAGTFIADDYYSAFPMWDCRGKEEYNYAYGYSNLKATQTLDLTATLTFYLSNGHGGFNGAGGGTISLVNISNTVSSATWADSSFNPYSYYFGTTAPVHECRLTTEVDSPNGLSWQDECSYYASNNGITAWSYCIIHFTGSYVLTWTDTPDGGPHTYTDPCGWSVHVDRIEGG